MDHRLAKVLGARLATLMPKRDVVGLVIMFDDDRMIDGDVAGALVEIADRIASRLHHVAEQRVSERNCARRIVDEARLNVVPALRELAALGRLERPDVELLRPASRAAARSASAFERSPFASTARSYSGPNWSRRCSERRSARPQDCADDQRGDDDDPKDDPGSRRHVLLLREVGGTTNGGR